MTVHFKLKNQMPEFLVQGLLTDLSIVLLVGFFDGVRREFDRYYAEPIIIRWEDIR